MFEYTCPECGTHSRITTIAKGQVQSCAGCQLTLRVIEEETPKRSSIARLMFVSLTGGLAASGLLLIVWFTHLESLVIDKPTTELKFNDIFGEKKAVSKNKEDSVNVDKGSSSSRMPDAKRSKTKRN